MRWLWSLLGLVVLCPAGLAQETQRLPPVLAPSPITAFEQPTCPCPILSGPGCPAEDEDGPLRSNRNFSNFIGFMSNPLENIDPRSLTQVWPIFLGSWVETPQALPNANAQIYGAGLNLALTDRLSVGLNQGGYAAIHIDRGNFLGRNWGGSRTGWLNLGGFAQYTLIEDVPDQFLLTAGLRVVVPSGSAEVFQGKGPVQMAPYFTVGKEFGDFHVLATGGYQFPTGSGNADINLFYLNAHLDYQLFGWVYPLVELNWLYHTTSVGVSVITLTRRHRHGQLRDHGQRVDPGGRGQPRPDPRPARGRRGVLVSPGHSAQRRFQRGDDEDGDSLLNAGRAFESLGHPYQAELRHGLHLVPDAGPTDHPRLLSISSLSFSSLSQAGAIVPRRLVKMTNRRADTASGTFMVQSDGGTAYAGHGLTKRQNPGANKRLP
jgi:hypothetical protein